MLAARNVLIPPEYPPDVVAWLVHHGQFSTYDVAGSDTLTRLSPRWDGHSYTDDVHDHELLDQDQTDGLMGFLGLRPVEEELRSWPPPAAVPPPRNTG